MSTACPKPTVSTASTPPNIVLSVYTFEDGVRRLLYIDQHSGRNRKSPAKLVERVTHSGTHMTIRHSFASICDASIVHSNRL